MNNDGAWRIAPAGTADFRAARLLMKAYAAGLGIDLDAQGFDREIADLPGPYAPPGGALLLAFGEGGHALGLVALKPLAPQVGEIKRLYVAPQGRGMGLGKALARAITEEARRIGYREIKLDTLPQMKEAVALYRSLGFEPVAPYGSFPYPGLLCFGRRI